MPPPRAPNASFLRALNGRKVAEVAIESNRLLRIHFQDGTVLSVTGKPDGLALHFSEDDEPGGGAPKPTQRQREYLVFIAKYIDRFGVAPAEADIQRHFLVSAPTVNQMMQMLERRGFIQRQPGVGRSIRLRIDIPRS